MATTIRFFKIIHREIVGAVNLKIPNKFARKYEDGLSNPVSLKPPDGTEWKVYWTKHNAEVCFQKGWKEFAKYYSLDHGYLVLFEYKGTSDLEVHIFDKSTLEIDYPFHSTHDENDNLDRITDDLVEILDELPPCKKKTTLKSPVTSPRPCKRLRSATTGDVERNFNLQNLLQHVQIKEDMLIFPTVGRLSSTKISEALQRATTFKPKNPSFLVVMKPYYVNGHCLHVPLQFAEKYLKNGKGDVLLQVLDGRTWPTFYGVPRITTGWKKFASDNNLKLGDVCVFELTKSRGHLLKVFIFRVEEEPSCPLSQGGEATHGTPLLIKPHPQTTGALEEAKRFTSENPSFIVNIRQCYLGKASMNVSIVFVRKYFEKKSQDVMIQLGKKLWPIKLIHYPSKRVAMFSAGWLLFARESRLQAGDVCVFELINREDAILDVHIFRGH